MKTFESSFLCNIGIFGHGSSGKTSLAEAMLFNAGQTTRLGTVEDGNTGAFELGEGVQRAGRELGLLLGAGGLLGWVAALVASRRAIAACEP